MSSSESEWEWSDSGADGDDEEASDDDSIQRKPLLRRFIREEIDRMYENRYENPRNKLPRGPSYLHISRYWGQNSYSAAFPNAKGSQQDLGIYCQVRSVTQLK
jgi:hypothetical protein